MVGGAFPLYATNHSGSWFFELRPVFFACILTLHYLIIYIQQLTTHL